MAKDPTVHNIDVSIRTRVMDAARKRVTAVRRHEQATTGVATTTMASVGRAILSNWKPTDTLPVNRENGVFIDAAGNRLTKRGHRKYVRADDDLVPEFDWTTGTRQQRLAQLLKHLQRVSNPKRGTTLGPIDNVRKAAKAEDLLNEVIQGKPFHKHLSAAERAVLKPLRFTLPKAMYQRIAEQLAQAECTMTRALEVGLEKFARTGKIHTEE